MRILYLSSVFPQPQEPTRGIYSLRLCEALAPHHEVRVVAPLNWLAMLRGARGNGRTEDLPNGRLQVSYPTYYYPPGVLRGSYGWLMWASVRRCVRKLADEFGPDCILSYWAYPDGAMAIRAARALDIPVAVMIGGSDVLLHGREGASARRIARVLREADAIVTVGQNLQERIIAMGAAADKVHIVPRGVDPEHFAPGDCRQARKKLGIPVEVPALVWVGRMVPVKGLDVLLEACSRLVQAGTTFRLYLVGDGPLSNSLKADCQARGLADRVCFVGSVAQEHLGDWYRAADYTLLPSRSEGVPNVLRESLACGTPFIASEVGGIPELTQGVAGACLVPPENAPALADVIASALATPRTSIGPLLPAIDWSASAEILAGVLEPLVRAQPAGTCAEVG
jgi:glycosyltransferase involved in cell wall biosynthesis